MSLPVKTLKNGFSLPVLGLGTWRMGGAREQDAQNDDTRDITAIRTAIDMGITHIDTAEVYAAGHSEELLGQAIEKYDRTKLFIASKVSPQHLKSADLRTSLKNSLKRLNTDYLDLYYIHSANHDIPFADTAQALNEAHKDGLIKNVAVSNFLPETFDKMQAHLKMKLVANQVHYNLMIREPETSGLLDHAVRNDYMIVAYRPLRFNRDNEPMPDIWEQGAWPIVDKVANENGKTNVQVGLNWVIAHPNVVALVKSSNPKHLTEIIGATGWSLSQTDRQRLTTEFPDIRNVSNSTKLQ